MLALFAILNVLQSHQQTSQQESPNHYRIGPNRRRTIPGKVMESKQVKDSPDQDCKQA
jgi:hypothetical protein